MLSRWLLGAALALVVAPLWGESYPARPLRLVVPFTPAGATDVLARLIGEELGKRLGQPLVIENRPGAGGNIGAQLVARAAPDGYTLLMAPTSIYSIAMTLYRDPGFDVARDFTPVSTLANVPHVLVAHPSLPASNVKELIALAKARPRELTIASQGTGTVSHLEAEMLQQMAGIELTHVPYKGSSPALLDLLGGRTQIMFDSIASAMPQVRAGKLKAMAVAAEKRASVLPDVPTLAEAALPGYRAESWLGILVPARTPRAVVERLTREIHAALADPRVHQTLVERGFEPQASSPEQFAERIRRDVLAWAKVVKTSGATVE
ncbi:MAG TPA: tripartite tricarboxylate transporter substrate binding protein [Burkholderiales bacterium]|nr:tripartite tricarboxylate transporter substrate binding protein [Burkholderiales bacterium]